MEKTCYVAETDETGLIVCVWTKPTGKRTARVFDLKRHVFEYNKDADYFGAKPMAIQSWLAAKLTAASAAD